MSISPPQKVRCRPIGATDLSAVANLLSVGFADRSRAYWGRALEVLARRAAPDGYPQFGYLLEGERAVVGVLLLIFTEAGEKVRCNVSSWYVDPAYRAHAAPLVSNALKFKDVTYLNISPARNTWPILEAQGYRRYSQGQVASAPALSPNGLGVRVRAYHPGRDQSLFPAAETALLDDHLATGCRVLVVEREGEVQPLVFLPRRVKGADALHPSRRGAADLLPRHRRFHDERRRCGPLPAASGRRGRALRWRGADPRPCRLVLQGSRAEIFQGPGSPAPK
jgi:hypothetical protein